MYTKYLTDRGQRKAFLETHRSMETRCRTQKENDRQEKLLLSGAFGTSPAGLHGCRVLLGHFCTHFTNLALKFHVETSSKLFRHVEIVAEIRRRSRRLETAA
jgi:hypothetical protein